MTRRDPLILLTLCVALCVHLAALRIGTNIARRELGWWQTLPSLTPAKAAANLLIAKPLEKPDDLIGEKNGTGKSVNSAPGDRPMESAIAEADQEQAMMSRDPIGLGGTAAGKAIPQGLSGEEGDGRPKAPPSPPSQQQSKQTDAQQAQRQSDAQRQSAAQPQSSQSSAAIFATAESALAAPQPRSTMALPAKMIPARPADIPDLMSSGPLAVATVAVPHNKQPATRSNTAAEAARAVEESAAQAAKQAPTPPAQSGTGERSGASDMPAGRPLPSGEFESVPVSSIVTRFVGGKIIAREGRKMLTRRLPDLNLAGWADVSTLVNPVVILRIKIDETGNVTEVTTIHSSGSDNIDLPCERAAQTWWFEPRKNPKTGKFGPEIIEFSLVFR